MLNDPVENVRPGLQQGARLTLVSGTSASTGEARFRSLVELLGVPIRPVMADGAGSLAVAIEADAGGVVALHADRLNSLLEGGTSDALLTALQATRGVLVYGWSPTPDQNRALAALTSERVELVSLDSAASAPRCTDDGMCRHFAGLELPSELWTDGIAFRPIDGDAFRPLLTRGDDAVFAHLQTNGTHLFLLADADVPDVHEPLSHHGGATRDHLRTIPYMLFLRTMLPEAGWRGLTCTARLIIDDPLLQERYGLLDFRELYHSMEKHQFGTTVAFIPWNHRRTRKPFASWLSEGARRWSVTVHGCDHTGMEFADRDEGRLREKCRLALKRMASHRARTDLPYEKAMVFPQGLFSTESLAALRDTGFVAAVNSGLFPTNARDGVVTMADHIQPAMTRFFGFPVFLRHYPVERVDFAFDVFVGKPALIVEHHEYFRDGLEPLAELVEWLNGLDDDLTWPPLEEQLIRSGWMRWLDHDTAEVMFFTPSFEFENRWGRPLQLRLIRHLPLAIEAGEIRVNGVVTIPTRENDVLRLETSCPPGGIVSVEMGTVERGDVFTGSPKYRARVASRRFLSEFRDNTLSRHPRLMKLASNSLNTLRAVRRR